MEEPRRTICWDCKKATGACSWSHELAPVPGWEAIERPIKIQDHYETTYLVCKCPEFERDSVHYGLRRVGEHEADMQRV